MDSTHRLNVDALMHDEPNRPEIWTKSQLFRFSFLSSPVLSVSFFFFQCPESQPSVFESQWPASAAGFTSSVPDDRHRTREHTCDYFTKSLSVINSLFPLF